MLQGPHNSSQPIKEDENGGQVLHVDAVEALEGEESDDGAGEAGEERSEQAQPPKPVPAKRGEEVENVL